MDTHPSKMEMQFRKLANELGVLLDTDPLAAIERARNLSCPGVDQRNIDLLAGGTLVDAGSVTKSQTAVSDGVAIFERLLESAPENFSVEYNLANGLMARANLAWSQYPEWYLQTAVDRARARRLYGKVASNPQIHIELRTQAYTNLGNALSDAYRYTEAYDQYSLALELDPSNGVAHAVAARLLLKSINQGACDEAAILAVAAQHLSIANDNADRIREFVGESGFQKLTKTLTLNLPPASPPDMSNADEYQRFVARHRLFLTEAIEGLDVSLLRWDSLRIDGISEGLEATDGVPPLFAMFNVLKADYLAARQIAFLALNGEVTESGNYSDTLDYATYGVEPALLTLAQRACLDLLDKIAVLASAYLSLPSKPRDIYFHKTWFEKHEAGRQLQWKQSVLDEITAGNTAIIAISELSLDVQVGGFLEHKRAMRHSSTHRFTVLHEIGDTPSRKSLHIDHYALDYFRTNLIETLQTSRAALLYTAQMIAIHESIHDDGRPRVELIVPDHDWVIGREAPSPGKPRSNSANPLEMLDTPEKCSDGNQNDLRP